MKKVCICGTATSSMQLAPWGDPDFELWGLAWRKDYPRVDVGFDLHTMDRTRRKMSADYPERCNPIYPKLLFQEKHELVPNSQRYPIEAVIATLEAKGGPGSVGDYFASTISYMMALAIHENRPEVHIYGVDLIAEEEWGYQRPNLEYLIGLARGSGMVVYVPPESAMLRFTHRYGYEGWTSAGAMSPRVLREYCTDYIDKRDKAMAAMYTAEGAMQATRNLLRLMERGGKGYSRPEESEGEPK